MSPAAPAPKIVIPDCATCSHPAVRAFVEVVSAVETNAPTWYVLDLCRELGQLGYKLDLIAPADDGAEIPPAPWHWHRTADGRIVSGLPIGTTLTIAPAKSVSPTVPKSARHDGVSNAKGAGPWQAQPPSLCGPEVASTTRGPGNPQHALEDAPGDRTS